MSGEGYTPSTEEVRDRWMNFDGGPEREDAPEFDRWLLSERARIWDEGFNSGYDSVLVDRSMKPGAPDLRVNPYRKGGDA